MMSRCVYANISLFNSETVTVCILSVKRMYLNLPEEDKHILTSG